ncbi:hypothetical protein H632_c394p1 [Helicosporidium sp. ATCC 50920]|nr:hypothetical protein H632_c394p1 [Helicosporidium sp. ATCC 50920]|eukprot:KDD76017.1 hypothetical protein H632_c394p1 [Helicosporidium sp. ATCC 50920]
MLKSDSYLTPDDPSLRPVAARVSLTHALAGQLSDPTAGSWLCRRSFEEGSREDSQNSDSLLRVMDKAVERARDQMGAGAAFEETDQEQWLSQSKTAELSEVPSDNAFAL